MTTATMTATLPAVNFLGFFKSLASAFVQAKRFERLFAMNDSQLKSRGLDRDQLVRSYISGLGHS